MNRRDPRRPAIRRKRACGSLDRWWEISRPNGIRIAITGVEYSGKTWAVVDWLAEQIGTHDDWPLTLIIPSFRSNELVDPVDALAEQLDWISGRNRGLSFWRNRVIGWLSYQMHITQRSGRRSRRRYRQHRVWDFRQGAHTST
jgi:hypothetical protein